MRRKSARCTKSWTVPLAAAYERRARLRGGSESLGPLERAYVEATQLAATNPQAAVAKLEALLDVFSGGQPERVPTSAA